MSYHSEKFEQIIGHVNRYVANHEPFLAEVKLRENLRPTDTMTASANAN
jgi:hypothetical protein